MPPPVPIYVPHPQPVQQRPISYPVPEPVIAPTRPSIPRPEVQIQRPKVNEENERKIKQLMDMGFTREQSQNALIATNGNLEVAADYLFSVPNTH